MQISSATIPIALCEVWRQECLPLFAQDQKGLQVGCVVDELRRRRSPTPNECESLVFLRLMTADAWQRAKSAGRGGDPAFLNCSTWEAELEWEGCKVNWPSWWFNNCQMCHGCSHFPNCNHAATFRIHNNTIALIVMLELSSQTFTSFNGAELTEGSHWSLHFTSRRHRRSHSSSRRRYSHPKSLSRSAGSTIKSVYVWSTMMAWVLSANASRDLDASYNSHMYLDWEVSVKPGHIRWATKSSLTPPIRHSFWQGTKT